MPTPDHPRSSRRRYQVFVEDYKHHRLDETIDALKGPKLPEAAPSQPEKGGAVSVFRRALRGKSREHIREYLRWLKPHRFAILTVFLFALIAAGIEMIQPLFMRFIIDRVLLNTALDLSSRLTRLQLAGATYLTVVVASSLIGALKDYRQRLLNVRVVLSLRRSLFDRLLHLPLPTLWEMKTGGILARLTGDVDTRRPTAPDGVMSPTP
jgi:ATP-binding cassette subfamily B protein/subfamily B ATP-binding cassette protein MsbA